jgi:hypothetical protein
MLNVARTLLLSLIVICVPALAAAATVKLAADPNTEPDWASDNLYRAPGACTNPGAFAKVSNVPKTTGGAPVQFSDVVSNDGTYCYAATALDTAGNESVFSNKVEVVVNVNPPSPPANLRSVGVVP